MESLGHDLLLLMLNLSRLRDRERIMRLFVEALSAATPRVWVRYLESGEEGDGEVVDVATPEAHFGRIAIEDPTVALTEQDRGRYRNAVRMLAVVLENVARAERLASENLRLDQAVAIRTAELQRSLAESNDLYQNASCGYHSLDANGIYVRVNDTELRWLGYEREELVGTVSFSELVASESQDAFARSFAELKERGAVQDVELEIIRKNNTRIPVLLSATAVEDAQKRFVMSRTTIYDLSERRTAERKLRESAERFWQSQKLEAIGRLAGGIAHDFNNLLTVIITCSELILLGLDDADPKRSDVETIVDAGKRAAMLTGQLLAFGRRRASAPIPTDLGTVTAGMEKMLRRLIGEEIELQIVCGAPLRLIRADVGQMEQVVLNLAVNARDAMPAGGRLRIETSNLDLEEGQGEHRRCIMLAVSDTGLGIAPEIRSRLFEPFFTTKAVGKGTGLGLATVHGITKQLGGSVRVKSAIGQGTRFEVILPATDDQRENAPTADLAPLRREMGTLLLVDDEPTVRSMTARVLRESGYTVIEAADGEEAIQLAASTERLDLLLTDVIMPRMRGADLAARLRQSRPDLRVLFMSGYPDDERFLAEDLGQGSGTLLEKPFTLGALTRAVAKQVTALALVGAKHRIKSPRA